MELAPVVLFVYNRPEHTRRTLEALSQNELADKSLLYIFADGPKNAASKELVEETRKLLRERNWTKKVIIQERSHNLGLAQSIVSGVTEVINKHGKVIVLEDDLLTSPGFLRYMNNALTGYADENRIKHISAYMYPVNQHVENGIVFLKILSCWGWGTWARAWSDYSDDVELLLSKLKNSEMRTRFNIKGDAPFYEQLEANANGKLRTWAVRWYASWWLQGGLAIFPKTTLVQNIGHDGSGVHCGHTAFYNSSIVADIIDVPPSDKLSLAEDEFYKDRINDFYARLKRRVRSKGTIIAKVKSFLRKFI